MQTVLITGGTGLVGSALTKQLLSQNYKVIILSRSVQSSTLQGLSFAQWNIEKGEIDESALQSADIIVHLAGANVAKKRWTEKRRKEILNSRVLGSALLYNTLKKCSHKIKKIVSASAIGWYGTDPSIPNPAPFTENKSSSDDFLGNTCLAWEQSVKAFRELEIDYALLRTGIVLSNRGGAFEAFLKPLRFGFASVLGKGNQVISWIHINDLVSMYMEAIRNKSVKGIYNAVAPEPVNNRNLNLELARQLRGRYYTVLPVPKFVLSMVMGEMADEVLKSATISCEKILQTGFEFQFPTIKQAIENLVSNKEV